MTTTIFMDEAGDTGWSLIAPYGNKGSSRFLILAAITLPSDKNHLVERIMRGIYRGRKGRSFKKELKSTELNQSEKKQIATKLLTLTEKHPDITLHGIVAEKANVNNALRAKSESLYTHMAEQMLHVELAKHAVVEFYPDARTVKFKDRHALPNYLETRLAISGHVPTIKTIPSESGAFLEIQCADVICAILFAHFERQDSTCLDILQPAIHITKLY